LQKKDDVSLCVEGPPPREVPAHGGGASHARNGEESKKRGGLVSGKKGKMATGDRGGALFREEIHELKTKKGPARSYKTEEREFQRGTLCSNEHILHSGEPLGGKFEGRKRPSPHSAKRGEAGKGSAKPRGKTG